MKHFKKLLMTLALLVTAVGGAWAQSAEPKVYKSGSVAVTDLHEGDILYEGVTISAAEMTETFYSANRWKFNGTIRTSTNEFPRPKTIEAGGAIDGVTPVTESGDDGNAWVVISTSNYNTSNGTIYRVYIGGTTYIPTEWDLTPDQTGEVWTLDKMPANNVELQVEYFAESYIYLGKDAMADKANITVKDGETTVAFNANGKSTTTVAEANTVTAKIGGTKKVFGIKVMKKVMKTFALQNNGDAAIYYYEGETWAQAIANHPTENAGWRTGKVLIYSAGVIYNGAGLVDFHNVAINYNTVINPNMTGYSWVSAN